MKGKRKNQNRIGKDELEITIHKRKIQMRKLKEKKKNVYIMSYRNPNKIGLKRNKKKFTDLHK